MNEKNQELTEIIVKPGKSSCLTIINDVKEWLYNVLNQWEKLCKVKKWSDDELQLDVSPSTWWVKEDDIYWVADIKRDPSVHFSDKRVNIDWHTEKKKVTWDGSYFYWPNFERYRLTDMDWIIELDNGKFLINRYWKYQPNLSFISSIPEVKFEGEDKENFNLPKWRLSVVYWDFFVSKKWTKCFRILPKEKAKHILICDDWWWPFNFERYRGRTLPEEWALYYRRASSNWWWTGYDYWIYEKDWRLKMSESDI